MSTVETRKVRSLETIASRLYRADKSNNDALWELAEYIAVQAASKVPQAEIAGKVQATLTNRAPEGAPVIRISQGRISQLLNGFKAYGHLPAARRYNPATLYQYLGKDGNLEDYERVAAERAQKRSKRSMNNGGKGGKEPGKGKDAPKDEGLSEAHKALAKFAASLDMTVEDAIWHLLEVQEQVVKEQERLNE